MRFQSYLLGFVLLFQGALLYSQNPAKSYLNFAHTSNKADVVDTLNVSAIKAIGEEWESFTISEGYEKTRKPNIQYPPTAIQSHTNTSGQIQVTEVIDTLPAIWNVVSTDSIIREIDTEDPNMRTIQFDFYGVNQIVSIPNELGGFHPKGISETEVSDFWQALSRCKYQRIITDCNKYKVALGYNDWAVLKWTQCLSKVIYPDNINSEQEIFTVFLLNQMGLRVRTARADNHLITLFSALQDIYAKQYIVLDTYPYYLLENLKSISNIYTYRIQYSKETRPLDLRIATPFRLWDSGDQFHVDRYSSVWEKHIKMSISTGLINFYNDYPQMDAKVYASAALSPDFLNLFAEIIKAENDDEEVEHLNKLLSFLHLDFKYKVDQEQFGKEKPFFCEENLIYPYNDCEDRSILLSSLVRHLLGLKVVLLDYTDHMALAVHVDSPVKGDYLILDNERYYVCDPTYIGATVGMSMPEYKNKPVTVYKL